MSNFIIAIVRTVIPIIVGWAVGLLATINIPIDADIQAALIVSLSTLTASLYYVTVAALERRWQPFGWLLGVARHPVYAPAERSTLTR